MRFSSIVLAMLIGSNVVWAADAQPVAPAGTSSGAFSSSTTKIAKESSPGNASETPRLNARTAPKIKARLDDGRSMGFKQSGGDQPAGDQQFRPADRVQAENDRLVREARGRKSGGGEQPAARDATSTVKTR